MKTKKRPVKCEICGEQMYYTGEKKYESEVQVLITDTSDYDYHRTKVLIRYAHKQCAKPIINLINRLKKKRKRRIRK